MSEPPVANTALSMRLPSPAHSRPSQGLPLGHPVVGTHPLSLLAASTEVIKSEAPLASAWELTQEESQPILHEPSLHQPSSSRWGPEDSKSRSERTSPRPSTGATRGLTASLSSDLFSLGKEAGMLVFFSKILKEQESHTVL